MGKRRYSDTQFIEAVRHSRTIAEVLRRLGLQVRPGNYATVHQLVEKFALDVSHWDPIGVIREKSRERGIQRAIPLAELLIEDSPYQTNKLKRRLLQEDMLENRCALCGVDEWQGKPLTLQLDHINGIANDHRLENLRLLCPNCHSQTRTFCRRKRKSEYRECPECGGRKCATGSMCRQCTDILHPPKIQWPQADELMRMVEQASYSSVARQLGVSDNAVRKRLQTRCGYAPRKRV